MFKKATPCSVRWTGVHCIPVSSRPLNKQFTMSQNLSDQEVIRRESLTKLRALGIEPFPAAQFPVTHTAEQVKALAVDEDGVWT